MTVWTDESEHVKVIPDGIVLVEKGKNKKWKHQHQYVKVKRNGIVSIQDGPLLPNMFTIHSVYGVRCPEPIIRNFRQSKIEMPKIISMTFSKVAKDVTPKIRTPMQIKRTFFAPKIKHDLRVGFLRGVHQTVTDDALLQQKVDTVPVPRPVTQHCPSCSTANYIRCILCFGKFKNCTRRWSGPYSKKVHQVYFVPQKVQKMYRKGVW